VVDGPKKPRDSQPYPRHLTDELMELWGNGVVLHDASLKREVKVKVMLAFVIRATMGHLEPFL